MKNRMISAILGAVLLAAPMSASALTLKIADLGTGDSHKVSGAGSVAFSGTVGSFTLGAASGVLTQGPGFHDLSTTAVQTSGVGKLWIMFRQTGLSDFGSLSAALAGTATAADAAKRIVVKHFIDTGSGLVQVGDSLSLLGQGGNGQSASTLGSALTGSGSFDLVTTMLIVSNSADQESEVRTGLTASTAVPLLRSVENVAAVPLPGAGLLLIGALGGLAATRRRRRG